ncbi:unnamed protein product [Didymodactylos carnosus]|uniref:Uncharacterized protein n=1 Tax=Didymodactylos carnosus TaxID=1234261 RepID=A0A815PAD5_9BILA|nr:unnamed protein product [Didymodactylos carnosus]CAF4320869.1 unnamed protein product [Didymodactylos carnosus]
MDEDQPRAPITDLPNWMMPQGKQKRYKHTKNKFIRTSYAKTVHERKQITLQPLMSVNPYDVLRPLDDFEMDEMDNITGPPTEARKARLPKRNSPPHRSLRPQINNYSHRRTQSTRNIEKQSNGNNTRQVQNINNSIDLILPKNFIREISSQQSAEIFLNVEPEFLIDIKKLQFLSEYFELQADLWGEYARAASPLEDPDECIDGDDAVMHNNNDGRLIIDHSLGKFPIIVNEV